MLGSGIESAGKSRALDISFSPAEIERPHKTIVELALGQNAVLIDNRVIIGFEFISPCYGAAHTERVLISRDRAIPVKLDKGTAPVQMWMNTELADEYGTVFRHPEDDFYIGPDYKIVTIERSVRDVEEGRLKFTIESMAPINHEIIPGYENFDAVLRNNQ